MQDNQAALVPLRACTENRALRGRGRRALLEPGRPRLSGKPKTKSRINRIAKHIPRNSVKMWSWLALSNFHIIPPFPASIFPIPIVLTRFACQGKPS